MDNWTAHKTNKTQRGEDFREVKGFTGKISELQFTIKPRSDYWRAGFKLVDPNGTVLPLLDSNSLLFHLGSTPSDQEYGFTAYLNGELIKELNKTEKYPDNNLLTIRLEINHSNFLKVYVDDSLEFKLAERLENPNVREKVALIAWGDENDYTVDFKDIKPANWKGVRKSKGEQTSSRQTHSTVQYNVEGNFFNNSKVSDSVVAGGRKSLGIKTKTKNSSSKETKSSWYKDPKIIVPAVTAIIVAIITAPWWTSIQQKTKNDDPNLGYQTTPVPTNPITPTLSPQPDSTSEDTLTTDNLTSIDEGKSYTDDISGITVGVYWVLPRSYSTLTITFPGQSSEEFEDVKSGRRFYYKGSDGSDYVLTIVEIKPSSINVRIDLGSD